MALVLMLMCVTAGVILLQDGRDVYGYFKQ
jgi:hypothetical protein